MILFPALIAILTLALCNVISWLQFRTQNRPLKFQFTLSELLFSTVCIALAAAAVMCCDLKDEQLIAAMTLIMPPTIFGLASGKFWNLSSLKPNDFSPVYYLALGAGVGIAIALAGFYFFFLNAFVR